MDGSAAQAVVSNVKLTQQLGNLLGHRGSFSYTWSCPLPLITLDLSL
jgi:hypothetical protein